MEDYYIIVEPYRVQEAVYSWAKVTYMLSDEVKGECHIDCPVENRDEIVSSLNRHFGLHRVEEKDIEWRG